MTRNLDMTFVLVAMDSVTCVKLDDGHKNNYILVQDEKKGLENWTEMSCES